MSEFDNLVRSACAGKQNVFIFISKADEVDTKTLIAQLLSEGKKVIVPTVHGDDIVPVVYSLPLVAGPFGIEEPQHKTPFPKEEIDIFFVPGKTFTKEGARKGRGKGYFDRFLRDVKGKKPIVGLCTHEQVVEHCEVQPWDVPVDSIIVSTATSAHAARAIEQHSVAKNEGHNEDAIGISLDTYVIVDGATFVTKDTYEGLTGGEIAAKLVRDTAITTKATGPALVSACNDALREFYAEQGLDFSAAPASRCTAAMTCAKIVGNELVVTCVGDVGFRINGHAYTFTKEVDVRHAAMRSEHYARHKDLALAREHILPSISKQYDYQNNAHHEFGYGAIDGYGTPAKFIRVHHFPLHTVRILEIFSDGYIQPPELPTVEAWEQAHERAAAEDPNRVWKYLATKENDDRTVLIVVF